MQGLLKEAGGSGLQVQRSTPNPGRGGEPWLHVLTGLPTGGIPATSCEVPKEDSPGEGSGSIPKG